jgi:hypothetical protein
MPPLIKLEGYMQYPRPRSFEKYLQDSSKIQSEVTARQKGISDKGKETEAEVVDNERFSPRPPNSIIHSMKFQTEIDLFEKQTNLFKQSHPEWVEREIRKEKKYLADLEKKRQRLLLCSNRS